MKHKVSFVIASRNENPETVAATIQGLLATSYGRWREIIVVDDASDVRFTHSHPEVIVLRNAEPIGSCLSRRRGSAAACGDVIVGMDAHMSFAPGWLELMLAHVDSKALLCPPWMDYRHTQTYCWGADFGWSSVRDYDDNKHPGIQYRSRSEPTSREPVFDIPMVIGACYMMRRDVYERLGGWNPLFSIYGSEEQDLSARAWLAGYGVKCVAGARVGHLDRDETNPTPFQLQWDFYEHNQAVTIRTIFDRRTSALLDDYLAPLPEAVEDKLAKLDLEGWRAMVQAQRRMSDAEFFRRFIPGVPLEFGRGGARLKAGEMPRGLITRAAVEEEDRLWKMRASRRRPPVRRPRSRPRSVSVEEVFVPQQIPPPRQVVPQHAGVEWTASTAVTAFGVSFGFRVDTPALLGPVEKAFAQDWRPRERTNVDLLYSLMRSKGRKYLLHGGDGFVGEVDKLEEVTDLLAASLRYECVQRARQHVFVDAAVVGWKGRALLVVGDRWSGRTALAVELLKAGATYYSHAFAALDMQGRVHPFAQALSFRRGRGQPLREWPASTFTCGTEPLPVGLIAAPVLEPKATWKPTALTQGRVILRMFANAINARRLGAPALATLTRAGAGTVALEGPRGDARRAARALLNAME